MSDFLATALFIVGILIGLFGVAFWGDKRIKRTRQKSLQRESESAGFTLQSDGFLEKKSFYQSLSTDRFFFTASTGGSGYFKSTDALTGTVGGQGILLFNHEYYEGSRPRNSRRLTLAGFFNDRWNFPQFEMRPGGIFSRSVMEPQNMNFEGRPDFSKKYYLKSKDEAFTKPLFDKGSLNFFENNPGFYVLGIGSYLLIGYKHKLIKPKKDNILHFSKQCLEVAQAFNY